MEKVIKYLKYLPAVWAAVTIAWKLYKSKAKSDGYREALKNETHKRIMAEAKLKLADRLNDSDDERMARLRREAERD